MAHLDKNNHCRFVSTSKWIFVVPKTPNRTGLAVWMWTNEWTNKGNWKIDGPVNVVFIKSRPLLRVNPHTMAYTVEAALNHGLIIYTFRFHTELKEFIAAFFFNEAILFHRLECFENLAKRMKMCWAHEIMKRQQCGKMSTTPNTIKK